MKLIECADGTIIFYCPACEMNHGINKTWVISKDMENPTITPSILSRTPNYKGIPDYKCHMFVKNGMIEYLSDCSHWMAGKTIKMEETK